MFADEVSDDEGESQTPTPSPLSELDFEDPRFTGFAPTKFSPPLDGHGQKISANTVFDVDTIVRAPVKLVMYSRQLQGVMGENNNELLRKTAECIMHCAMRVDEAFGNRVHAPLCALLKEGCKFKTAIADFNRGLLDLGLKVGFTVRVVRDTAGNTSSPKATLNGNSTRLLRPDGLLLKGFDLTQEGLHTGAVQYPSKYMEALRVVFTKVGWHSWVRHTLPRVAGAWLD